MVETPLLLPCDGGHLLGILAEPGPEIRDARAPADGQGLGVIIVVGGPQYRVGSHRHFVKLARELAEQGLPTLRFDVRGMGDSPGEQRDFLDLSVDLRAAIDGLLGARPQLRQVVLWGLCDGASAALLYLQSTRDRRVAGLCLVNPWVRSEDSVARTYVKHYYRARLFDPKVWKKAITGGLAPHAVQDALKSVYRSLFPRAARSSSEDSYQHRMADGLASFKGQVLIQLSDNDYTAKEFAEVSRSQPYWRQALATAAVQWCSLSAADHTLSSQQAQLQAKEMMAAWLRDRVLPSLTRTSKP